MGEEAFRGVAICCFCRPAVKTVGSYSQAPSFELEQSDFCVSVYETARETQTQKIPQSESGSIICFFYNIKIILS